MEDDSRRLMTSICRKRRRLRCAPGPDHTHANVKASQCFVFIPPDRKPNLWMSGMLPPPNSNQIEWKQKRKSHRLPSSYDSPNYFPLIYPFSLCSSRAKALQTLLWGGPSTRKPRQPSYYWLRAIIIATSCKRVKPLVFPPGQQKVILPNVTNFASSENSNRSQ